MSLRALALLAACASCGGANRASRAEVSLHTGAYVDDDDVSVYNPSVRAKVPLSDRVTVSGGYGVDIISAASVDIVTSASRSREERHEANLGARVSLDPDTAIEVSTRGSIEPDYRSLGASLTYERQNQARDRTLRIEMRARYDEAGPGWVLQRPEALRALALNGQLVQVLDRRTLLTVGLQAEHLAGWQASVYRYVQVGEGWYPERTPEARTRANVAARVQRSLAPTVAVSGEYGAGLDTWGAHSHTVEATARWELNAHLMLDLRARLVRQEATDFYRGRYETVTAWRTRDRLLGAFTSVWPRLGARFAWPAWPAPRVWELGVSAGWMHQRFDDFPLLPVRNAATAEVWLTRAF
jgi:hypothetical protein